MKERLADRVYKSLRDELFSARYEPNQLIVERDVAAKYGVSEATASEALHRLCSEGHLTSHPRSGYTVTLLTPQDVQRINRMRLALESLVIDILCAEKTDEELRTLHSLIDTSAGEQIKFAEANFRFHLGMASLTGDKYLVSTLTNLIGALSRVEIVMSLRYSEKWHEHHRRVVDCLLARDAEGAKRELRADLTQ